MTEKSNKLLAQSKPWRSDAKWELIALEAVILLGLGVFMLINTESAGNAILQIIGLVLLVVSLQVAVSSFRQKDAESNLGVFDSFRAGIGVTVGVIATSLWWADSVPNGAVRLILGWGLIAYTALHLAGLIVVRGKNGLQPMSMALSALALVLGIMLLTTSNTRAEGTINFLGVIFLVFGVLLGGLAYLMRSRETAQP